jgi:hypothetical protein
MMGTLEPVGQFRITTVMSMTTSVHPFHVPTELFVGIRSLAGQLLTQTYMKMYRLQLMSLRTGTGIQHISYEWIFKETHRVFMPMLEMSLGPDQSFRQHSRLLHHLGLMSADSARRCLTMSQPHGMILGCL